MEKEKQSGMIWDVIVIGGGPAGMIAAGRAAERGKSVLLLEKNRSLGKKLLITGGGRCNLTNNKPNVRSLLENYKDGGKFLFSAFARFGVPETMEFFRARGLEMKEENGNRIFPVSDKARSVLNVLVAYLRKGSVQCATGVGVSGIERDEKSGIFSIKAGDDEFKGRSCVVATGGTSRPDTGSTGEGFGWVRALGHTIRECDASLVPVSVKDEWVKKLAGVALSEIKISVYQNGKRQISKKGRLLFTHFGISGPTVLNMSRDIGELLRYGDVEVKIDLFPAIDSAALDKKVLELFSVDSNKKLKNSLGSMIPAALVSPLIALASVDGETANNSVKREDRVRLVSVMKAVPLRVDGLLGPEKAIVSSGGVDPAELDFKTMQSRIVPNLFVVGDMLDIDRPSGGYSLQLCWTTGYVAGNSC